MARKNNEVFHIVMFDDIGYKYRIIRIKFRITRDKDVMHRKNEKG